MKTMTKTALTFVERTLRDGAFGDGVIAGFDGRRVREARAVWLAFRQEHGLKSAAKILTPPEAQPKLGKSVRAAFGLMLTPARGLPSAMLGRIVNLCPMASKGCAAACLGPNSGKGVLSGTRHARNVRTAFLLSHPFEAGVLIGSEIAAAQRKYGDVSLRLNTVSDIRWEFVAPVAMGLLIDSGIVMYDYTAWRPEARDPMPGYHLTYSAKEPEHTPDAYLVDVLRSGRNVAMPFAVRKGKALPDALIMRDGEGRPFWFDVIDGDLSDDRTLDRPGVIVGLRQKGRVKDATGFIRSV